MTYQFLHIREVACVVVIAFAVLQGQGGSYEVYLTHVFVVLSLFNLFLAANKPMKAVPALFLGTILVASVLGDLAARGYSEPMNHWLRTLWEDGPKRLGSVIESDETAKLEGNPSAMPIKPVILLRLGCDCA